MDAKIFAMTATVRQYFGNIGELMELYLPWFPEPELVSRPDFLRIKCGISSPLVNSVLRGEMDLAELRMEARRTREYFANLNLPGNWMVVPDERAEQVGEILIEEGYTPSVSSPGMVIGNAKNACPPHPELEIHMVDTAAESAPLRELLATFGLPDDLLCCIAGFATHCPERLWNYIGFVDGTPACCGALFFGSPCPGIYNVATSPEFRCRGFGAAITSHMIAEAGKAGFDEVFLIASKMGYGVYKKLGFEDIGTARYYSCANP